MRGRGVILVVPPHHACASPESRALVGDERASAICVSLGLGPGYRFRRHSCDASAHHIRHYCILRDRL